MKKYIIDYTNGSINDHINKTFDTREDAERCMKVVYTDKEREELEVVPVEVGYAVYVDGWDKGKRYVWNTEDIEHGGYYPHNGYNDLFDTREEAMRLKNEIKEYIAKNGYTLTAGIEEFVKV